MTEKQSAGVEVLFESLVNVARVTKVVKGGRRFSFAAYVVSGDKNGSVGCAHGKAKEVSEARTKASQKAKKSMKKYPLYQNRTIHYDVFGKSGAAKILLRRAKPGTGIIAGGAVRAVLQAIGVKDIVAKSLGSSNSYSVILATFDALNKLHTPKLIAFRRGIAGFDSNTSTDNEERIHS